MHHLSCSPAVPVAIPSPLPAWHGRVKPSTRPVLLRSYLAEIPNTSAKFREIVAFGREDEYVGVVEVALGGTYCRCKFITESEYHRRKQKTKVQKSAPSCPPKGQSSRARTHPSLADPRAAVAKAKRAQVKAKGRFTDAVGKVSRILVPASRRIRLTLTSLQTVADAPRKLRVMVAAASKKFRIPDMFGVWRRALQGRGTEHFHLQVYLPGTGPLSFAVMQDVADFLVAAWAKAANQSTTPQVQVSFPTSDEDLDRIEAYDASQATHPNKAGASQPTSISQALTAASTSSSTKKPKNFGILRRNAYNKHVQVEEYVIHEVCDLFTIRRLLRSALNAEMKTWKRPRRHRPRRYAVEAKFHLRDMIVINAIKFVMKCRHGGAVPLEVLPPPPP